MQRKKKHYKKIYLSQQKSIVSLFQCVYTIRLILDRHLHVCFVRLSVYKQEKEKKHCLIVFSLQSSLFCSSHPPVFKLYEIEQDSHRDWIPKRRFDQVDFRKRKTYVRFAKKVITARKLILNKVLHLRSLYPQTLSNTVLKREKKKISYFTVIVDHRRCPLLLEYEYIYIPDPSYIYILLLTISFSLSPSPSFFSLCGYGSKRLILF